MPKRVSSKPNPTVAQLRAEFRDASDSDLLSRKVTAAGIGRSVGWLELKALTGGGPAYFKNGRQVLYRKSDTLGWYEAQSQRVTSTREYAQPKQVAA